VAFDSFGFKRQGMAPRLAATMAWSRDSASGEIQDAGDDERSDRQWRPRTGDEAYVIRHATAEVELGVHELQQL
jgi:hypothetical protein